MSDCQEVLFISDVTGVIQCVDPCLATTFVSYRGLSAFKANTLTTIGKDYLLAVDATKPIANIWPLNSQEPLSGPKLVLIGKATTVAASPDGVFCVTGIDSKIYIHHISSGQLIGVISKHYRSITKLLFMDDSCHFVSCGENGSVFVWSVAITANRKGLSLIESNISREPVYSFSHHSLRVTDAYVGPGSLKGRLFTSSLDQTCKIYNLRDGSLLLSILIDTSLTALKPSIIESELFFGTNKGDLIQYKLDPLPRSLEVFASNEELSCKYVNHTKAITCLDISVDGSRLVSAGEDCKVIVWDIPSKQLLRLFNLKGAAASVFFCSSTENMFTANFQATSVTGHLQKVFDNDQEYEVNVRIESNLQCLDFDEDISVEASCATAFEPDSNDEVARLKEELAAALAKNKQLYKFAMTKIVDNPFGLGLN